jgi:hypothetical protein
MTTPPIATSTNDVIDKAFQEGEYTEREANELKRIWKELKVP